MPLILEEAVSSDQRSAAESKAWPEKADPAVSIESIVASFPVLASSLNASAEPQGIISQYGVQAAAKLRTPLATPRPTDWWSLEGGSSCMNGQGSYMSPRKDPT